MTLFVQAIVCGIGATLGVLSVAILGILILMIANGVNDD
jgi:hypothetical protein